MGIVSSLLALVVSNCEQGTEKKNEVYKVDVDLKAQYAVTSTVGLEAEQCQAYFREILQNEFAEYTFREGVSVVDIVGEQNDSFQLYKTRPYQAYKAEWGAPYNFAIYRDDKLVGTIMLGEKWSHYNRVKFLISKMYMKKMGVAYIPFYTELSNDVTYVVHRLREFLQ